MHNDLEKKKHRIDILEKESLELEEIKRLQRDFDKRISFIVEKINKSHNWKKDFDLLRKDRTFRQVKPYS